VELRFRRAVALREALLFLEGNGRADPLEFALDVPPRP
jgi:hypothetical protein